MNDREIGRLFMTDIREKKRIGSNIYRRVSTRRGGSNMSSMRVPSKKQQKELSGKVTTYNLGTIVPYGEFKQKSEEDQKRFLKHWKDTYKSVEIMEGMGISKNIFYKLLKDLDVEVEKTNARNTSKSRVKLAENELEKILEDKENFYDFDLFKKLISEQQDILFEEYFNRVNNVTLELERTWEGSNSGYLYYIKGRVDKKQKARKKAKETPVQTTVKEKSAVTAQTPKVESITPIVTDSEENTAPIEQHIPTKQAISKDQHTVNITMESEDNSFNYSLKGVYHKYAVIRRLKMILEELEESNENLTVEINIKG